MKIALLGDTHFGYRIDSEVYTNYVRCFYDEVFFPYLDKHNIKTVFQLGDLMDNRRYLSIKSLRFINDHFLLPLKNRNIELVSFLGNHDVMYKNTNDLNSPRYVVSSYDNVELCEVITEKEYDGVKFGFVPWINKENTDKFEHWINTTEATICLGHFELNGFEYFRGVTSERGMDHKPLKKFKQVYSGHFHIGSHKGNIRYIGTPYEMTFNDLGDEKGFWILDTNDLSLERVINNNVLYRKIIYDDESVDYDTFDFSIYKDCYLKVYVIKKKDIPMYNRFIDNIYKTDVIDVDIIERDINYDDDFEQLETQDTFSIILDTVNGLKDVDNASVISIMNDLYKEATLVTD